MILTRHEPSRYLFTFFIVKWCIARRGPPSTVWSAFSIRNTRLDTSDLEPYLCEACALVYPGFWRYQHSPCHHVALKQKLVFGTIAVYDQLLPRQSGGKTCPKIVGYHRFGIQFSFQESRLFLPGSPAFARHRSFQEMPEDYVWAAQSHVCKRSGFVQALWYHVALCHHAWCRWDWTVHVLDLRQKDRKSNKIPSYYRTNLLRDI